MARIYPNSREDAQVLAQALLDAAGEERHDEVRTTTDGPLGLAFDVPDDLAELVLGVGDSRVVQPTLSAPDSGASKEPAGAGETKAVPAAAGEERTSVVAGTDVSEVDAKPADGSSQPSATARRSRSSRSG